MLFLVLCFSFLVLFILYYRKQLQYWHKKGIPQEKPLPIVGNILKTLLLQEGMWDTLRKMYNKYDAPYVGFYMFDEPSLLIRDPKLIKNIMVRDFHHFKDRNIVSEEDVDPISAHILFSSKSPAWGELRKKVTPIFTVGKLRNMYGLIYDNSNDLIKHLEENPGTIDTRDVFARYTIDVIASTCFGIQANAFSDPNSEFRKVSEKIFDWTDLEIAGRFFLYFLCPKLVKLLKISIFHRRSIGFLKNAFTSTMLNREASNTKKNDFVDLLLGIKNDPKEQKVPLTDVMILAQAIQFFVAGFETTNSTITYCLYELAKTPEVQRKLKQEIKEHIKEHKYFGYEDLKNLKYLDMVISETLRKYPVVPFLDRRCNESYTVPGTDFTIDKNTRVYITTLGLHYDEAYFENPESFIPERWENSYEPYTYLPFGEGPRNCIGARFGLVITKLAIARVINEFTVDLSDQTPRKMVFDVKGLILSPVGGLHLKFKKDVN